METMVISAELRDKAGVRGVLSSLRGAGKIPAVIYGLKNKAPVAVSVEEKALANILKTNPNGLITMKCNGSEEPVIIKSVQYHPVLNRLNSIDFMRVSLDEKIEVNTPIKLVGESVGVKVHGGLLVHSMRSIRVLCLPKDIMHHIDVDISKLGLNEAIRVKDLKFDNVEFDAFPEQIIVSVVIPKEEKVAAPAPGAAAAPAAGAAAPGAAAPAAAGAAAAPAAAGAKKEEPKK